jgi:hypothetical protein
MPGKIANKYPPAAAEVKSIPAMVWNHSGEVCGVERAV